MKTNIIFFIISRSVLPRMRNVSEKFVEEIKTHNLCSITFFFFSENRALYEIMWKNIVEPDKPRMIIWRVRIARWITKATDTHSAYVILIAFPLQKWLHERALLLYMHCESCVCKQITP